MKLRRTFALSLCSAFVLAMGLSMPASALTLDEQIEKWKVDVPRVGEIIKIVADPTQPFDKRLHSEFWGLMLTRIHEDPAKLSQSLRRGILEGMDFQVAFWKSLELSVKAHKVVKVPAYANAERVQSKMTAPYPDIERRMLESAATGKPFVSTNGQSAVVDAEMVERAQARLAVMEVRLLRLTEPNWKD